VLRPQGLFLVSFHVGAEVRHLSEWWGHAVDVDFRFFEPPDIAGVIERSGFRTEMRLERVSYSGEVNTRRAWNRTTDSPCTLNADTATRPWSSRLS
jgi:hypothetical protein